MCLRLALRFTQHSFIKWMEPFGTNQLRTHTLHFSGWSHEAPPNLAVIRHTFLDGAMRHHPIQTHAYRMGDGGKYIKRVMDYQIM